MISVGGAVFELQEDYSIIHSRGPAWAVGSGEDAALAVMAALEDGTPGYKKPHLAIQRAFEAVARRNVFVCPPWRICRLPIHKDDDNVVWY